MKKLLLSKKLKTRILLFFIIVAVFSAFAISLMYTIFFSQVLFDANNYSAYQATTLLSNNTDSYIEQKSDYMDLIFSNKDVLFFINPNSEDLDANIRSNIRSLLTNITSAESNIISITIFNSNTEYISNEIDISNAGQVLKTEWYQQSIAHPGSLIILDERPSNTLKFQNELSSDGILTLVKSVIIPSSSVPVGVIAMDISVDPIAQNIDNASLSTASDFFSGFLLNSQGDLVYSSSYNTVSRVRGEWFSGHSGTTTKIIDNMSYQFVYTTSPDTGFKTVGMFATMDARVGVDMVIIQGFIIIAACLAGAVLLSIYFSRQVVSPIINLNSLMKKVQEGDMDARFVPQSQDEIGDLGNSFNHMIETQQQNMALIYRAERDKHKAKINILYEQIKPHFLYNTFDSIQWMAMKYDAADVIEVIQSLTTLLRYGLNKGSEITTAKNEVAYAEHYLKIQKVRYKDQLNFKFNIDKRIDDYYVQKLILQPMIENAIYHGIKLRRVKGYILIRGKISGEDILFEIIDNGAGMTQEKQNELNASFREGGQIGFGMFNVNSRLKLNYGEEYCCNIKSKLGFYTKVTLRHPIVTEKTEVEYD